MRVIVDLKKQHLHKLLYKYFYNKYKYRGGIVISGCEKSMWETIYRAHLKS